MLYRNVSNPCRPVTQTTSDAEASLHTGALQVSGRMDTWEHGVTPDDKLHRSCDLLLLYNVVCTMLLVTQ